MIPKTIHQIWVGTPLPKVYEQMGLEWQRMNPGWNYKLWRDEDLRWLKNQDLFDNAARFAKPDGVGQMMADVARYEILSRFGGVYVDMDTEPLKPFDPLLDGVEGFAGYEEDGLWIANGVMGAVPNHPFMQRMIDVIPDRVKANTGKAVTWMTGPRVFTGEWNALSDEEKKKFVIYPQKTFYPYSYLAFRNGSTFDPAHAKYPDSYAVHHWRHQRELRGRPLVVRGNGNLSVAIMAHEKRAKWVPDLEAQLPGVKTVWDRKNDRWDTGSRALMAHNPEAEWHLVVQDDALLPPDFYEGVRRMLSYVPPGHPVGLYYGRHRPRAMDTENLVRKAAKTNAPFIVHNGPWWGVGIVMPVRHIRECVEWADSRQDIANYDTRISRFYYNKGIPAYYTNPSLIEHRTEGNPSLVPGRTGTGRRAWRFVGPQSALSVDWSGDPVRSDM